MAITDMDLMDRKILVELDKNSRISYSALGKRIRAAKETVRYRIHQLEKKGVVRGYYAVVNLSKLGVTLYRVYLRLENISTDGETALLNYLVQSKSVAVLYGINGSYHIAMGVWVRNPWEFQQFWIDLKMKFGKNIASHHFSLLTDYHEYSRLYVVPGKSIEKEVFAAITQTTQEKLDYTDFRLVSYLSNNARASLVEISKELKISLVTSRSRLKNLIKKKIIIGFRAMLNISALGREYYKVDLWLRKFDRIEVIKRRILSQPNVIFSERSLISGDLEFDVEVENFEKFIEMMDSFRASFPEDVKDYTYYSLVKNYKTDYVPKL